MKVAAVDQSKAVDQTPGGHFQGLVGVQKLVAAPEELDIECLAVFFAAGARNYPHIHQRDQILYVTEGRAIVAVEGERRVVCAGEAATIPGGVWHWHGATKDGPMCHLSIKGTGDTRWDVELRDWAKG